MDKRLSDYIKETYQIENPENPSELEIDKVLEINCVGKWIESIEGLEKFKKIEIIKLSDNEIEEFNLTNFENLKVLDFSSNPVKKLDIKKNTLLEEINFSCNRGNNLETIDLSHNLNLKKIIGGQDGIIEIDLSNNEAIEEVIIQLSSHLRYINLKNCSRLKRITLWGVLIPYVDLTKNDKLEYVNINYLNTYMRQRDKYGPGYPRPIIFVNEGFSEEIINKQDREHKDLRYFLIVNKVGSTQEKILKKLEAMKETILEIQADSRHENIPNFHYEIREMLDNG